MPGCLLSCCAGERITAAEKEEAMSDKGEIRELLARYCFALDAERFDEMAALFTADGVWETAFGTGTGRDGIVAQARSIASGERPRRVHLTTNIVIDIVADTATVQSNWGLFQNSDKGAGIGSGGGYFGCAGERGGGGVVPTRRVDPGVGEGG